MRTAHIFFLLIIQADVVRKLIFFMLQKLLSLVSKCTEILQIINILATFKSPAPEITSVCIFVMQDMI